MVGQAVQRRRVAPQGDWHRSPTRKGHRSKAGDCPVSRGLRWCTTCLAPCPTTATAMRPPDRIRLHRRITAFFLFASRTAARDTCIRRSNAKSYADPCAIPCIWRKTPSPREFRPFGGRLLKGQPVHGRRGTPISGVRIAERYSLIRFSSRSPNPWNNLSCPMPAQHPFARQLRVLRVLRLTAISPWITLPPSSSPPPAGAPVRPAAPSSIARATFTALNLPVVVSVVVGPATSMLSPLQALRCWLRLTTFRSWTSP